MKWHCIFFQDLEYELRRRGSAGNAYVGLRLAKATEGEAPFPSPPKSNESKDLLNLQVHILFCFIV